MGAINRQARNLLIALVIIIISGSLFGMIVHFISNGLIKNFDLPIIEFVQGLETPWLTVFLKAFTWIGSAYGVVPITLLVCAILFYGINEKKRAIFFAFSIVSTIILNESLKLYFVRERPEIYRLMDSGGFSFPSGHTMMAVSLYGMIVYVTWHRLKQINQRMLVVTLATFIAFLIVISRIYVGVHFPSDIVGGIAASTCWITIIITAFHLLQRSKGTGAV